jgi:3-deoxy-D-manno-octulosonic-acid transferase
VYLIYSVALAIALALYLPFYFLRTKLIRKDRLYLRERLGRGIGPLPPGKKTVWFHAVSMGEVLSLQHLIRELKTRHPEWAIAFSSLTNSGLAMARAKLRDVDAVFFVPLDFPGLVRRTLRSLDPGLLVLAESEFWPNLLRETKKSGAKVLTINGRISEDSYKKLDNVRPLALKMLNNVDLFLVQTVSDRERLEFLGVDPERVRVAGNLKSEVHLPEFTAGELAAFRRNLGLAGLEKVIVAGSTRKGEEDRLLKAFSRARGRRNDLRFIVAPRHIERAAEIEKAALALGFRTVRRTAAGDSGGWDVLILDTIGELARFYALSDASFVGGSLVEWGGHNILEPAFYGKPVFFGPHMKNFASLAESFLASGAARIVRTDDDLEAMFLLEDGAALRKMGEAAATHLASLGGATERTIKAIEGFMGPR